MIINYYTQTFSRIMISAKAGEAATQLKDYPAVIKITVAVWLTKIFSLRIVLIAK